MNFGQTLKANLDAAGYTVLEQTHGALMAEMRAAVNLVPHPAIAMAISNTFSKALALLSERDNVSPERTCDAADLIYAATMIHAHELVSKAKGKTAFGQPEQPIGDRPVMVAGMDDSPATDPKDIN